MTKVLLLALALIVSLVSAICKLPVPAVNAEDTGPYATIYPSNGTVYTNISIEVRNLTYNVHYSLYLYWDDVPQIQGLDNPNYFPMGSWQPTWLPYYNIEMNAPNEHPLSDLGMHTIMITIWTFEYIELAFNSTLTFEITEQLPCSEYLALNTTYYQLLADFNALNTSYQDALDQYYALSSDFNALQNQYNNLLGDYSSLLLSYQILANSSDSLASNYSSLLTNYNFVANNLDYLNSSYNVMKSNFNTLSEDYSSQTDYLNSLNSSYFSMLSGYQSLITSYAGLQNTHNQLQTNFNSLQTSYSGLNTNYDSLQTDYTALANDLSNTRNLNYILAIATATLLATTVYFAVKKPKTKQQTE